MWHWNNHPKSIGVWIVAKQQQQHYNEIYLCEHLVCTWMRAAALGSEELMRTGWEISILCLLLSWAVLWLTDSAENECLFLAFFLPSPLRWLAPFPLDGEAQGEGPRVQGPNGDGSELGPGTLDGVGLSISISCLAVSFNWEERRGLQSSVILNDEHGKKWVCVAFSSLIFAGSVSKMPHNNHHLKQLVYWDSLCATNTLSASFFQKLPHRNHSKLSHALKNYSSLHLIVNPNIQYTKTVIDPTFWRDEYAVEFATDLISSSWNNTKLS